MHNNNLFLFLVFRFLRREVTLGFQKLLVFVGLGLSVEYCGISFDGDLRIFDFDQ